MWSTVAQVSGDGCGWTLAAGRGRAINARPSAARDAESIHGLEICSAGIGVQVRAGNGADVGLGAERVGSLLVAAERGVGMSVSWPLGVIRAESGEGAGGVSLRSYEAKRRLRWRVRLAVSSRSARSRWSTKKARSYRGEREEPRRTKANRILRV
jgi:hypothetical protein